MDEDSKEQRTALHEATEGGHTDITELLLKQSEVDPTVRDNQDHTPYDIAYSQKNDEVKQNLTKIDNNNIDMGTCSSPKLRVF